MVPVRDIAKSAPPSATSAATPSNSRTGWPLVSRREGLKRGDVAAEPGVGSAIDGAHGALAEHGEDAIVCDGKWGRHRFEMQSYHLASWGARGVAELQ